MAISNLIILGNGFDLSLGLKTSYQEFMNCNWFKDEVRHRDNGLVNHLNEYLNSYNWIDIETELGNYANELHNNMDLDKQGSFRYEYSELCKALKRYLSSCELGDSNETTNNKTTELFNVWTNSSFHVLTFNYTNTVELLLKGKEYPPYTDQPCITHIHGDLCSEIVFGIEDSCKCPSEFTFIRKSFSQHQNINRMHRQLLNASNIIFYGYSLGESDHSYFDDFFESILKISPSKNITFYYHGDKTYQDIYIQLDKLTKNKVTKLKQTNKIQFLDSSKL